VGATEHYQNTSSVPGGVDFGNGLTFASTDRTNYATTATTTTITTNYETTTCATYLNNTRNIRTTYTNTNTT